MKLPQLQQELRKKKVDYLVLTSQDPNFTYFSRLKNFSSAGLAIPLKGKPFLFYFLLDKEKITTNTRNILIKKSLEKTLRKYLNPRILAYNSQILTVSFYKRLKKIFPQTKFKDFSQFLQQLRTEKTKEEIFYLKKAASLTGKAFQQIIKNLKFKKFKTENEIRLFLERFASQHQTELSFPPIIASGKNSAYPHHQPTNQKLVKGFLLIDFGVSYQNYCSDMTRVVYLGKPSPREKEIYEFLLKIQKEVIKNLKLNLKFKEIEEQARRSLGKYSSYFTHSLGHGVGVEVHEPLTLKPKSEEVIKKNRVLTIEPGIYFKDFGLRIEDIIWMKEGAEVLTKTGKRLMVIE